MQTDPEALRYLAHRVKSTPGPLVDSMRIFDSESDVKEFIAQEVRNVVAKFPVTEAWRVEYEAARWRIYELSPIKPPKLRKCRAKYLGLTT